MLAELENISYYVQTPGHNKRFPGHNSGGILNLKNKLNKKIKNEHLIASIPILSFKYEIFI